MSATRFQPSPPLRGALRPPPDKSISHRAALIGAMGEGEARVEGFLDAADTRATLEAVRLLGAAVEKTGASEIPGGVDLVVHGVGLRGPGERAGDRPLGINVANAGTLLRMLPGWLAGQGHGAWRLDGDESLRGRPVDRIAEPLGRMGALVECRAGRYPPVLVRGAELVGTSYRLPVASAQVKSCVLLAGLLATGETSVIETVPTRDHTELILAAAGAELRSEVAGTPVAVGGSLPGRRVTVRTALHLEPGRIVVPGDFSSAAFVLVAAALVPGSEIRLEGVGLNPTRIGLLGILNRMGAAIEVEEGLPLGGEARGTIAVRRAPLRGVRVAPGEVPLTIDELPLVALLGCFAEGETLVTGAEELRHKESDRIAALTEGLGALGADIEALADGFAVRGTGGLRGGMLESRGDHRLAMLGAVAGLTSREGVEVIGMDSAAISYPAFDADLASLGQEGGAGG
jgi:3-phosphoshikimate 1-carboxyvinyltransferase